MVVRSQPDRAAIALAGRLNRWWRMAARTWPVKVIFCRESLPAVGGRWRSRPPRAARSLEAYRFRRQLYYATCAILVSIPSSYSEGVRYPSPF